MTWLLYELIRRDSGRLANEAFTSNPIVSSKQQLNGLKITICLDNSKTFQAAAKRLKQVIKTVEFNDFLTKENIKWKFNLPRAPQWGGHFDRLLGLTKQPFFKSLGKTSLSWNELESVLLDVEVNFNNRPLTYIEDDIQCPILTPNSMLLGRETVMLEKDPEVDDRNSWKKTKNCKMQRRSMETTEERVPDSIKRKT